LESWFIKEIVVLTLQAKYFMRLKCDLFE
jgi:hypothetical protein